MPIPLILAMDGFEIDDPVDIPPNIAWMCHLSPGNNSITSLPGNAMIVLTDRNSIDGCDPQQIVSLLSELAPAKVLLDFQQPVNAQSLSFAKALAQTLPCPVGVSKTYAQDLPCPVFLPPIPPNILPQDYLTPWGSREVWLEVALDACEITVTTEESSTVPLPFGQAVEHAHRDADLYCHYFIRYENDALRFYLYRTREDVFSMLDAVDAPNVTLAVGLLQELAGDGK